MRVFQNADEQMAGGNGWLAVTGERERTRGWGGGREEAM